MPRVLLVNLGTPAAPEPEAVKVFLRAFLSDPQVVDYPAWLWRPLLEGLILRRRPHRVARLYQAIWGAAGSPLLADTRAMAAGLAARLGPGWTVQAACRYGRPSLAEALAQTLRGEPVFAVPLFPQPTAATTGTIQEALRRAAQSSGLEDRLQMLQISPEAPYYIEALAAAVRDSLPAAETDAYLLSFHGIPRRVNRREGDRYRRACLATAEAFRQRLGLTPARVHVGFQSRFGPEPWLGPATARLLARLPRAGVRRLAVLTPGFLTEGLETLEEIALRGRETFLAAGGEAFHYVSTVGRRPEFLAGLARELRTRSGESSRSP